MPKRRVVAAMRDELLPLKKIRSQKISDIANPLKEPSKWLFKSEPSDFSINDLFAASDHQAPWDGVRNAQVVLLY